MSDRDFKALFTWRSAIAESDLDPTTRHVALTMSLYMNERGGSCYPSVAALVHDTGLSERAVRDHRKRLEDLGWLACVERGGVKGDKRRASAYEARVPDPGSRCRGTPAGGSADPGSRCPPSLHGTHHESLQDSELPLGDDPAPPEPEKAKKPRARDPIWDALTELWGDATTPSAQSFRGRIVRELKAAGATGEETLIRGRRLLAKGWTDASPAALAKHWDALAGDARQAVPPNPAAYRWWEHGE